MSATSIEWATHVWNPFTGCDRVSPGCAHCYAAETAKANQRKELGRERVAREQGKPLPMLRYQNDGDPNTSGPGFGFTVHWDKLERPQRFPAGARVFVNSMSDVFHEDAPAEAIAHIFAACVNQPHADFLILTKRPERMRDLLGRPYRVSDFWHRVWRAAVNLGPSDVPAPALLIDERWQLTNVWLGVSIENRRFVHRAEVLAETPAEVRFISAEPLLGPLISELISVDGLTGETTYEWDDGYTGPGLRFYNRDGERAFDWLISGAESGPERRRFDPRWARALRDECTANGIAYFHKQGSAHRPGQDRELDGRTWDELPQSRALEPAA